MRGVGMVIHVDGIKYRCDPGSTYGDGGKEYNVRLLGDKGDTAFVRGQVTRFYVQKNGAVRESDPRKSKLWKTDTPRSQWLDWRPFALAFHEKKEKRKADEIKRRATSAQIRVKRDGKHEWIWRNSAKPSELEAWMRGDKI